MLVIEKQQKELTLLICLFRLIVTNFFKRLVCGIKYLKAGVVGMTPPGPAPWGEARLPVGRARARIINLLEPEQQEADKL